MANENNQMSQNPNTKHSPRWFIWTLVFLLVAGVSLVTYITVSGNDYSEMTWLTHHDKPTTQHNKAK